jgi:hypothetical protein
VTQPAGLYRRGPNAWLSLVTGEQYPLTAVQPQGPGGGTLPPDVFSLPGNSPQGSLSRVGDLPNGGVNNGLGIYGATLMSGVTHGRQMGPTNTGAAPALAALGKTIADLTTVTSLLVDGKTASPYIHNENGWWIVEDLLFEDTVDSKITLSIRTNKVKVRRCVFRGGANGTYQIDTKPQYSQLVIEDCTLDGQGIPSSSMIAPYGEYTMRRCNVSGYVADALKSGRNCLVEFNWVHGIRQGDDSHADTLQVTSGDNVCIRMNRFDSWDDLGLTGYSPNDPTVGNYGNSCGIWGSLTGNLSNVYYCDNYLNGGNYTLYWGSSNANLTNAFTARDMFAYRNQFGRRFRYGPLQMSDKVAPPADIGGGKSGGYGGGWDFDVDTNVWADSGPTFKYLTGTKTWVPGPDVFAGTPVRDSAWSP